MTDTQAGIGGDERVVPEPKSPRQSEDKKYAAKSEQIGTDAKKAIADLRSAATKQSYVSWKAIAVAIGRGQEIAQEKAGGNKRGPDYDEAINSYYKKYGLDKLSKDTRSNCQTLCDHDERWKSTQACFDTLPVEKQVTLPRHPKSLLKRFEEQVSWFGEFAAAFPDKMPAGGNVLSSGTLEGNVENAPESRNRRGFRAVERGSGQPRR